MFDLNWNKDVDFRYQNELSHIFQILKPNVNRDTFKALTPIFSNFF